MSYYYSNLRNRLRAARKRQRYPESETARLFQDAEGAIEGLELVLNQYVERYNSFTSMKNIAGEPVLNRVS